MSVALPRILRTSSFRLTLIYAGLFAASALMLLVGVSLVVDLALMGFQQRAYTNAVLNRSAIGDRYLVADQVSLLGNSGRTGLRGLC